MLSTILNTIDSLDNYPDFGEFYQDYVKELEDDIPFLLLLPFLFLGMLLFFGGST